MEAPTKRERASTKKETKAREEAKEKEVRPLFGSSGRLEIAPIVPPSNPNNDSRVYEVDIDVDTRKREVEVKQMDKDEEKERFDAVKEQEQQKPSRNMNISIPAESDYSQVNESFKSEEKA